MPAGRFVAYYRVSTAKQGQSGLGLEAQRAAVLDYLNGGKWSLLAEFTEVESGKHDDRPELAKAFAQCKLTGSVLLIAKLDRLSRDACFLLGLEKAGIEFVACDMPNANRLTVGIMAVVAQEERRMISERTRAALQAARERGVKLGGCRGASAPDTSLATAARVAKANAHADMLAPVLAELHGMSLHQTAIELTQRGIVTPRGGAWTATAVRRVMLRHA
jgi:DNA invertase Pin-like site-specific DNA recombinase